MLFSVLLLLGFPLFTTIKCDTMFTDYRLRKDSRLHLVSVPFVLHYLIHGVLFSSGRVPCSQWKDSVSKDNVCL